MSKQNCPSCWAEITIFPWIVSYVCNYCNTILLFQNSILSWTWEKSEIIPFPTTLKVNWIFYAIKKSESNSLIKNIPVMYLSEQDFSNKWSKDFLAKFYVYWNIRYIWNSIYNKFFLRILDDNIWLDKNKSLIAEEDEWQIKLFYVEKLEDKWFFDELYNSSNVYKNWFFIQEKWVQNIEWFSWWINFNILNVKESKYLNLVWYKSWDWVKNFLVEKYTNWEILYWEGI